MSLFSKPDALNAKGPQGSMEAIGSIFSIRFHGVVEPAVGRVENAIYGAGFGEIIVEDRNEELRSQAAAAQAMRRTVDFVPDPADMQSADTATPVQPVATEADGQLSPQLAALGYTTVNQSPEGPN